jgi:hypothetical protein
MRKKREAGAVPMLVRHLKDESVLCQARSSKRGVPFVLGASIRIGGRFGRRELHQCSDPGADD